MMSRHFVMQSCGKSANTSPEKRAFPHDEWLLVCWAVVPEYISTDRHATAVCGGWELSYSSYTTDDIPHNILRKALLVNNKSCNVHWRLALPYILNSCWHTCIGDNQSIMVSCVIFSLCNNCLWASACSEVQHRVLGS